MRYDNLRAFSKHLQSASPDHLLALYLLVSKTASDLQESVQFVLDAVFPKGAYSEMEVRHFSSEGLNISSLLDELNTLSFFAKKRVVILHSAEKLNKSSLEIIEKYFEKANPSVHFVITAEAMGRGTKFYKKAEAVGVIVDIPEEKAWQKEKNAQAWLQEKVLKEGKEIEPRAVFSLVKQVGVDRQLLEQELFKLYCYLGERTKILEEDVAAICSFVNIDNVWKLGEDIFKGDAKSSLTLIKQQLDDGVPFLALLRQLRTQFQTSLQICSLLSSGHGREDVSRHFRYLTGTLLNKKIQEAQGYGQERLKKGLLLIDEAELKAKTSVAEPTFLAQMLAAQLTLK